MSRLLSTLLLAALPLATACGDDAPITPPEPDAADPVDEPAPDSMPPSGKTTVQVQASHALAVAVLDADGTWQRVTVDGDGRGTAEVSGPYAVQTVCDDLYQLNTLLAGLDDTSVDVSCPEPRPARGGAEVDVDLEVTGATRATVSIAHETYDDEPTIRLVPGRYDVIAVTRGETVPRIRILEDVEIGAGTLTIDMTDATPMIEKPFQVAATPEEYVRSDLYLDTGSTSMFIDGGAESMYTLPATLHGAVDWHSATITVEDWSSSYSAVYPQPEGEGALQVELPTRFDGIETTWGNGAGTLAWASGPAYPERDVALIDLSADSPKFGRLALTEARQAASPDRYEVPELSGVPDWNDDWRFGDSDVHYSVYLYEDGDSVFYTASTFGPMSPDEQRRAEPMALRRHRALAARRGR